MPSPDAFKNTTFTLVAYQADSCDFAAGQEFERACSEHEIAVFHSLDTAAYELAQYQFQSRRLAQWRSKWEVTVLVDGRREGDWPGLGSDEPSPFEAVRVAAARHLESLEADEADRARREQEKLERTAELARKATLASQESAERAEYERLRQKFG